MSASPFPGDFALSTLLPFCETPGSVRTERFRNRCFMMGNSESCGLEPLRGSGLESLKLKELELGNIGSGAFAPVLAKHSKLFSLIDCVSVGVDRMQRSFEPMRKQGDAWQRFELTDVTAKVVIYEAFVEELPASGQQELGIDWVGMGWNLIFQSRQG